jgi:hypothetical protein
MLVLPAPRPHPWLHDKVKKPIFVLEAVVGSL